MTTMIRLARRNLWRHPRRTMLTSLAIAFVTTVLIFFIGIQNKSWETAVRATLAVFHGHLQMQHPEYLNKPQIRHSFRDSENLRRRISDDPEVTATALRAFAFALASSEDRSFGVQVIGVEPNKEPGVSTIPGLIKSGVYLNESDKHDAAIGTSLAKNLKIDVGDELTLLGQGHDGSVAATVVSVVGLFESGTADLDRNVVQIPLRAFQDVFMMPNQVHSLVIRTSNIDRLQQVQQRLITSIAANGTDKTVSVRNWEEIIPGLRQSIELDVAAGRLFYFSLVLIVTLIILNTFLMSVLERTKEFGIMLALGTTPSRLVQLIVWECFMLTLIGIFFGVIGGALVIVYFGTHGFSVPGAEEIAKQWNLPVVVYPEISIVVLGVAPVIMIIATSLSIVYPALKVLRLKAVEAMNVA